MRRWACELLVGSENRECLGPNRCTVGLGGLHFSACHTAEKVLPVGFLSLSWTDELLTRINFDWGKLIAWCSSALLWNMGEIGENKIKVATFKTKSAGFVICYWSAESTTLHYILAKRSTITPSNPEAFPRGFTLLNVMGKVFGVVSETKVERVLWTKGFAVQLSVWV